MIGSLLQPQPKTIEDYVLENNAMLQVLIHSNANMMQWLSDIYSELYFQRTGELPINGGKLYQIRSKMAEDRLNQYKMTANVIFKENLKTAKSK